MAQRHEQLLSQLTRRCNFLVANTLTLLPRLSVPDGGVGGTKTHFLLDRLGSEKRAILNDVLEEFGPYAAYCDNAIHIHEDQCITVEEVRMFRRQRRHEERNTGKASSPLKANS